MAVAAVTLWGREIAAVSIDAGERVATFQYDPAFVRSGIELSPVHMPLREAPYRFPGLPPDSFTGLPGLLADSLPDRWGRSLVDAWLASQGRTPESFDVVERLCYVGTRGMGALEFEPARDPGVVGNDIQVDALVRLASEVLAQREEFIAELAANPEEEEMRAILAVGTSAGGARPKALIAFNERTGQVRSGQIEAGEGFRHWLLKFDGVSNAGDHGLTDPKGWGAVEYAYWKMAQAAGVEMTESRLLEEHDRRHFLTLRFDRTETGAKIHSQTLGALEHVSYNEPGVYSYERAFLLVKDLGMDNRGVEQLFRRMVFNVVARNQDDHVKNISFLMDRTGAWSLAPAYDITWAYNPSSRWLNSHQMTINGKRDDITLDDLRAAARVAGLKRGRADGILGEVTEAVRDWPRIAREVGVREDLAREAARTHRLRLAEVSPGRVGGARREGSESRAVPRASRRPPIRKP
jgi:serine/threonine-protein kinase HipA